MQRVPRNTPQRKSRWKPSSNPSKNAILVRRKNTGCVLMDTLDLSEGQSESSFSYCCHHNVHQVFPTGLGSETNVARRSTQHNPIPTAAVADPSQGSQKRTNYKDKQSICTAGTFRLTCTHAMANQALLCQPYPFRNQIKSLRPHHDINP